MHDQLTSCTAAMLGIRSRSFCVTATRTVMTCNKTPAHGVTHALQISPLTARLPNRRSRTHWWLDNKQIRSSA